MPLDFGFAVRRYLNVLKPQLIVIAETEFWPNLLHLARKRQTSVAIVNARISDRSFPRYKRFKWFFGRVLSEVDLFLTQTAEDAQRLRDIGAPTERVRVSGNLKFDVRPNAQPELVNGLRAAIGKDSPVIVCGSTAEGEEGPLLAAFKAVQQQFPAALMVLAPRHPERFEKVAALISSEGFLLQRRTQWKPAQPIRSGIFLLDSVGELAATYELADIAFVGGSLVPTGGHNILEPAQYGAAILVGPHTFNFREIVSLFEQEGAVKSVTAETVGQQFLSLLNHPDERQRMGRACKRIVRQTCGSHAPDAGSAGAASTPEGAHAMNPLSAIFGAGVAIRNALYDRRIFQVKKLARPVVSIGNISVGGSGKTPFVIALGQLLAGARDRLRRSLSWLRALFYADGSRRPQWLTCAIRRRTSADRAQAASAGDRWR